MPVRRNWTPDADETVHNMESRMTKSKAVAPKLQIKAAFEQKGEKAARALGEELEVANHRVNRWLTKEWPAKAAKPAANKTTAKKTVAKKNATKKAA